MKGLTATALCLCLLVGCSTAYQRHGFTGGFDETQLQSEMYRVSFKGNGYTSSERAADLALLRCAEITLQNGYAFFAIVDGQSATNHSSFTMPTQSYTTGNATAYRSGPNVNVYGNSTTTTYGGQTFMFSKPSSTNTIILLKDKSEAGGMVYDAKFLSNSLSAKYGVKN